MLRRATATSRLLPSGVCTRRCQSAGATQPDPMVRLADPRIPVFASAASSDLRPRIAAREAFDIAASAMPKPPNFAMVNVSMDHSDMLDAPGVVWGALSESAASITGGVGNNGSKTPTMIAQAVRDQRFGSQNFLEVLLGHIPGLESEAFTFDSVPTVASDDVFLGVALVDWRLSVQHMASVQERLRLVSSLCPGTLVGGVLPPAEGAPENPTTIEDFAESAFCFNDSVLRGGAGAVLLRSPAMRPADLLLTTPSAPLASDVAVDGELPEDRPGQWLIRTLDGKPATTYIRDLYESKLAAWETVKVFLGCVVGKEVIPVPFKGDVDSGVLVATVPPALLSLPDFRMDIVHFVCDAPDHDKEALASQLLSYDGAHLEKVASKTEVISVARECKKTVVVSEAAALHWSTATHYDVMERPEHGLHLRADGAPSTELHAPSIVNRAIGGRLPTTGIHCGAQIQPLLAAGTATGLDRTSSMCARSAVHAILRSRE